ncbi:MAG: hypothetical protein HGA61_03240 [Candidatus Moranbacteria bacterium]|nr:hypothetical protein [Candidatus Moranbacteria bacterium]
MKLKKLLILIRAKQKALCERTKSLEKLRGATSLLETKNASEGASLISTYQLFVSSQGESHDIDYPLITEDAEFPLAQKPLFPPHQRKSQTQPRISSGSDL